MGPSLLQKRQMLGRILKLCSCCVASCVSALALPLICSILRDAKKAKLEQAVNREPLRSLASCGSALAALCCNKAKLEQNCRAKQARAGCNEAKAQLEQKRRTQRSQITTSGCDKEPASSERACAPRHLSMGRLPPQPASTYISLFACRRWGSQLCSSTVLPLDVLRQLTARRCDAWNGSAQG